MRSLSEILATTLPFSEEKIYSDLLSFVDLTTLEGSDTKMRVAELCDKAKTMQTAAVCVYPTFASQVSTALKGSDIRTACVAGAFPSGQSPILIKVAEVDYAVAEGAQEIDMVISRGAFLEENYDQVGEEVAAIKAACGRAHLKVILETGELQSVERIFLASEIAIANGADFIKTSTGKISVSATPEAAYTMLSVIQQHLEQGGDAVGFKAAGGISELEQAVVYYKLVYQILGESYLNKALFRIGASRLADKLWAAINR